MMLLSQSIDFEVARCPTHGLSPTSITKKFLSLKKIELGETEEGFADVEARVQSVLHGNMEKVFTQHLSEPQCFRLSGKGQTLARGLCGI